MGDRPIFETITEGGQEMMDHDLYRSRNDFFLSVPKYLRTTAFIGIGIGSLVFIAGMALGHHQRTWGSFLFNLLFFFSLALGGSAFGNMQDLIGALWARPIKRVHESFAAFLPIGGALIVTFFICLKLELLGAHKVYTWIDDPSFLSHFHGKDVWLQPNFMLIRDVLALGVILYLAHWHHRTTTAADIEMIQGDEMRAREVGEESRQALRHWSAPILVTHSICFSLLVFDLTMSLAPTWFSTLWEAGPSPL